MPQEMTIKKATIHFIYPFLPVMERVALSREALERIAACKDDIPDCQGGLGKPDTRSGLSTYMALDLDMAYLRLPPLTGRVENLDVLIEPTVRVFPLGSTCCFTVRAPNLTTDQGGPADIQLDDVHKLLHLVSQKRNLKADYEITGIKAAGYEIPGGRTTLFELLTIVVDNIVKRFNWDEQLNQELPPEKQLTLLGKGHFNKCVDEYQCPWVVTVLEPEGSMLKAFCTSFADEMNPRHAKRDAIREYEKHILPILYRSVKKADFEVDPAYPNLIGHESSAGIHNMNIDARLFVHMSRRSILCMCASQQEDPAHYFLPVLIDLCEMIHTRSNTLILLNKILDESLKNFAGKEMSPKQRLHKIIGLINQFMSCLEDPTTYVISGDALREIQEKLMDTSRIESLSDVVLKKMDMLQQLYKYRLELSWAERVDPIEADDDGEEDEIATEPATHA